MFQFAVRGEKKFWKILIIYYTLNMRTQNTSFYSQYQWSIHLPRNVFISIPHSPYFSISGLKYYPWSIITVPVVHCISGTQYYPRSLLHQSVVHGTTQGPYSLDQCVHLVPYSLIQWYYLQYQFSSISDPLVPVPLVLATYPGPYSLCQWSLVLPLVLIPAAQIHKAPLVPLVQESLLFLYQLSWPMCLKQGNHRLLKVMHKNQAYWTVLFCTFSVHYLTNNLNFLRFSALNTTLNQCFSSAILFKF